jgi:glutathione S-transferase
MPTPPLDTGITLYFAVASRAFVPRWMLEELGVPYRVETLDLRKGEHKRPEYLRIHPLGKVPALTDGPVTVTEYPAINLYLADRYSYKTLAPSIEDPERGRYLQWHVFATAVLEPAQSTRPLGSPIPPMQAGWGSYDAVVDALTRTLEGREYLLDRGFSAADVCLGSTIAFGLYTKQLPEHAPLVAYNERLKARPAFQRAQNATWPPELFPGS